MRTLCTGRCGILVGMGLLATLCVIFAGIAAAQEGSASAPKENAAVEHLQEIKEKAADIKSVKAIQTMSMSMMGQVMKMGGDVYYLAPDRLRMEFATEGMPLAKTITVSDGETAWTHTPSMHETRKIDLKRVKETLGEDNPLSKSIAPHQQINDFRDPFSELRGDSIQYVTTETLKDVDCYVFEGELDLPPEVREAAGIMTPQKLKIWLGKDDGMLRKHVPFNVNGTPMMEMTYTDVQVNTELDESLFTYTPKPDEKVIDTTESILRMLQTEGEGTPESESMPEGSQDRSEMMDRGI